MSLKILIVACSDKMFHMFSKDRTKFHYNSYMYSSRITNILRDTHFDDSTHHRWENRIFRIHWHYFPETPIVLHFPLTDKPYISLNLSKQVYPPGNNYRIIHPFGTCPGHNFYNSRTLMFGCNLGRLFRYPRIKLFVSRQSEAVMITSALLSDTIQRIGVDSPILLKIC